MTMNYDADNLGVVIGSPTKFTVGDVDVIKQTGSAVDCPAVLGLSSAYKLYVKTCAPSDLGLVVGSELDGVFKSTLSV